MSVTAAARVGFIGLGNMGGRMAAQVAKRPLPAQLVVYNKTVAKAHKFVQEHPNTVVASTLTEVADRTDVVMCCLAPTSASWQALLGLKGLIRQSRPGSIIIDHSTVDLETTMECHEFAKSCGVSFLDAPVSGGPEAAANGTLSVMVGGDQATFERVQPLLAALGPNPVLMGGPGGGTLTKLVNQLLTTVHTAAAAEAMQLTRRFGLNAAALIDLMERSYGGSRMFARNAPLMLAEHRDKTEKSAVPLRNLAKDVAIIRSLSGKHGITLPQLDTASELLQQAIEKTYGDSDISFLAEVMASADAARLASADAAQQVV